MPIEALQPRSGLLWHFEAQPEIQSRESARSNMVSMKPYRGSSTRAYALPQNDTSEKEIWIWRNHLR
jgi:hypothetical protein